MTKQTRPTRRGHTQEVFSREEINQTTSDVKSVLSKVFRKLVFSSGRNPVQKWNELMDDYVKVMGKNTPLTPKNIGYTRGNTKHELMNIKMSWAVFCKGLRFLKFTKFRIIIIATHEDGKQYYTDDTVNIANIYDDDDENVFVADTGNVPEDQTDKWFKELIESNRYKV